MHKPEIIYKPFFLAEKNDLNKRIKTWKPELNLFHEWNKVIKNGNQIQ